MGFSKAKRSRFGLVSGGPSEVPGAGGVVLLELSPGGGDQVWGARVEGQQVEGRA